MKGSTDRHAVIFSETTRLLGGGTAVVYAWLLAWAWQTGGRRLFEFDRFLRDAGLLSGLYLVPLAILIALGMNRRDPLGPIQVLAAILLLVWMPLVLLFLYVLIDSSVFKLR